MEFTASALAVAVAVVVAALAARRFLASKFDNNCIQLPYVKEKLAKLQGELLACRQEVQSLNKTYEDLKAAKGQQRMAVW